MRRLQSHHRLPGSSGSTPDAQMQIGFSTLPMPNATKDAVQVSSAAASTSHFAKQIDLDAKTSDIRDDLSVSPFNATIPDASKPPAVFFEVFSGCCQLSVCMAELGFTVFPIDSARNKHVPLRPVLVLDLNDPTSRSLLLQKVVNTRPAAVHVALPCGTGSRARERPIPKHLLAQGAPAPVPLRDASHILGLPTLNHADKKRVELANQLAEFTIELLKLSMTMGFFMSIENPLRSWMWGVLCHYVKTQASKPLAKFWNALIEIDFANCAHGGKRDKQTRFLCTHNWLQSMSLPCPGNHQHEPFQLRFGASGWEFDTAKEGEYPELLCQRYSQNIRDAVKDQFQFAVDAPSIPSNIQQNKRHPALMPEYHRVVFADQPPTQPHKLLTPSNGGQDGAKSKFGIYHSMQQFVNLAKIVTHPFDVEHRIPLT